MASNEGAEYISRKFMTTMENYARHLPDDAMVPIYPGELFQLLYITDDSQPGQEALALLSLDHSNVVMETDMRSVREISNYMTEIMLPVDIPRRLELLMDRFGLSEFMQREAGINVTVSYNNLLFPGVTCYQGPVPDKGPGIWFGVWLIDHPGQGNSDGSVSGKRYFTCNSNCAVFVSVADLIMRYESCSGYDEVHTATEQRATQNYPKNPSQQYNRKGPVPPESVPGKQGKSPAESKNIVNLLHGAVNVAASTTGLGEGSQSSRSQCGRKQVLVNSDLAPKVSSSAPSPPAFQRSGAVAANPLVDDVPFKLNDRVCFLQDECDPEIATVRWIGWLSKESNKDLYVGIEFDKPVGNGTGILNGDQLFVTKPNYAALVPASSLFAYEEATEQALAKRLAESDPVRVQPQMSTSPGSSTLAIDLQAKTPTAAVVTKNLEGIVQPAHAGTASIPSKPPEQKGFPQMQQTPKQQIHMNEKHSVGGSSSTKKDSDLHPQYPGSYYYGMETKSENLPAVGRPNPPSNLKSLPPLNPASLRRIDDICSGRSRGIQGHKNSCYLDVTLFSMFAFTNVFDEILHRPRRKGDKCGYEEVQFALREGIVNPLRNTMYVPCVGVMRLRELMGRFGKVTGLINKERDPEEFLTSLLQQILQIDPLLKLTTGDCNWHTLFIEKDQMNLVPSVQQLLDESLVASNVRFKEVPKCLLLLAPRSGQYKMYRYIFPSPVLDITDAVADYPRKCSFCQEEQAEFECKGCYNWMNLEGKTRSGLSTMAFCKKCSAKRHQRNPKHKPYEIHTILTPLPEEQVRMELFAVVCIEASNHIYVAFAKDGNGLWYFVNSMSDRDGREGDHGSNIPEVRACPEFCEYLDQEFGHKRLTEDFKSHLNPPEFVRAICEDCYIFMYQPIGAGILDAEKHQANGLNVDSEILEVKRKFQALEQEHERVCDERHCKICLDKNIEVAFQPCGHLSCSNCSRMLQNCPVCRKSITAKIKLYF